MFGLTHRRTSPIGLHVTPQMVTAVQLSGEPGRLELHAWGQVEIHSGENASSDDQDRATAGALKKLLGGHAFRGRQVVTCLGSQELFVQNVRLPKLPAAEVDKVVRWEAEERLPYPVADAEIRHLLAGEVRQDANVKQEVILLACHNGVIQRHIAVLEAAGLVPEAIDVEPCAIVRCLGRDGASAATEARIGYLYLGHRSTAVIIAEGQQIIFLKYITGGGHQWDLAVSRQLDVTLREASEMRACVMVAPSLDDGDEVHRSIIEAIRPPLMAMTTEVELCLRYHKVTFRGLPMEKMFVTGSEAAPWLMEFLTGRLGLPCEAADPFAGLRGGPRQNDLPGKWTAAIGLSLR